MSDPLETDERRDDRLAQTAVFRMIAAVNHIAKPFYETYGKTHRLTIAEWRCMMAMAAWPGMSGEDIARRTGTDRMTVSRSLRKLEKDGRARREVDPEDRKRRQWSMTPAGWEVHDAIARPALKRQKDLFSGIAEEDIRAVNRVMSLIVDRLGGDAED